MERKFSAGNLLQTQFHCGITMPASAFHCDVFAREFAQREIGNIRGATSLQDNDSRFPLHGLDGQDHRVRPRTRRGVHDGIDEGTDCTISASQEIFEKIVAGEQNPTSAYMTGKLKLKGDMGAAMKLQKLFPS